MIWCLLVVEASLESSERYGATRQGVHKLQGLKIKGAASQ
jgi:hypothetical protein